MTAEDFRKAKGWIITTLKKHESVSADGIGSGIRRSHLITLWLEEKEDVLVDESDHILETKKIRGVINRLVKNVGFLIIIVLELII